METRDKYKDNGISLVQHNLLCWCQEVKRMAENDPELLNDVYRDISEKLGMDVARSCTKCSKGSRSAFLWVLQPGKNPANHLNHVAEWRIGLIQGLSAFTVTNPKAIKRAGYGVDIILSKVVTHGLAPLQAHTASEGQRQRSQH